MKKYLLFICTTLIFTAKSKDNVAIFTINLSEAFYDDNMTSGLSKAYDNKFSDVSFGCCSDVYSTLPSKQKEENINREYLKFIFLIIILITYLYKIINGKFD